MEKSNLTEALQPVFNKLQIEPTDFLFDDETKSFISLNTYSMLGQDRYYIVAKVHANNRRATIQKGISDGITFFPTQVLGKVNFKDGKWFLE